MAVAPEVKYPGVYVQEVPSEVRTISPVSTSTTAMIGAAPRGPDDRPVTCSSWGDYTSVFGAQSVHYPLSYAVRDFFLNGGRSAVIVRVVGKDEPGKEESEDATGASAGSATGESRSAGGSSAEAGGTASSDSGSSSTESSRGGTKPAAPAIVELGDWKLRATSPGLWGNKLSAALSQDPPKVRETIAKSQSESQADPAAGPVDPDDLYDLSITDSATGATESYQDVTFGPGPRQIDAVLSTQSSLAEVAESGEKRPEAGTRDEPEVSSFKGGEDGPQVLAQNIIDAFAIFDHADIINLMVIPPYGGREDVEKSVWEEAAKYCEKRRAVLLVDAPGSWDKALHAKRVVADVLDPHKNAALYFPRLVTADPLRGGVPRTTPATPAVAGVIARTDAERGVWKAPAGIAASVVADRPSVALRDADNGELNPRGINCIRTMPAAGTVVWGARTTRGDDRLADQWKYLPVRRTALLIEESLYRGTQWAVFEPNDEPLWSSLRLNVGVFMQELFRQGAFQGAKASDAYFVACDASTTTQSDRDRGIVNVVVGFAPLKPAEFVVLYIQQTAGQLTA